ncbi:hypothetical protein NLI96_g3256 [Meripilus lineatus]|uniref:DUF6534 domain-containing protein n=1 Tax=Meripilus lineatus TaxID=2056292 RepID=A0AAD5YFS8_9APHY|nr:hypothetical protein NLI96_g3256 [Physisporinus lineatus]
MENPSQVRPPNVNNTLGAIYIDSSGSQVSNRCNTSVVFPMINSNSGLPCRYCGADLMSIVTLAASSRYCQAARPPSPDHNEPHVLPLLDPQLCKSRGTANNRMERTGTPRVRLWTAQSRPIRTRLVFLSLTSVISLSEPFLLFAFGNFPDSVRFNSHGTLSRLPHVFVETYPVVAYGIHCSYVLNFHILQTERLAVSLLYISFGTSAFSDFLIAGSLCVMLRQHAIVSRHLCALASIITFATMPRNFVFMGIYILLPKLYLNSLLATLNARHTLRAQVRSTHVSLPLSSVNRSHTSAEHGQMDFASIHIDTAIETFREPEIVSGDVKVRV